ncbi:unnamed protein product [Linum trigynum]|uniref:Uncharacterized protein n=1 Tax=Linum trigynum TaxID=586398 RepID=A0AAV2DPS0_9ROSI
MVVGGWAQSESSLSKSESSSDVWNADVGSLLGGRAVIPRLSQYSAEMSSSSEGVGVGRGPRHNDTPPPENFVKDP